MSTINPITAASTPAATNSTASALATAGGLTQADFLKLMTTQLQSQDPTNPVDNSQFVSQMAQFSQLTSSQDLLTSVNGLSTALSASLQSSQVLSSTNLINRQVLVPSTTMAYSGSSVSGAANVSATGDVSVSIVDATGKAVRTMDLGTQNAGLSQFAWDGKDDSGNAVASGTYSMAATSNGSALSTYAAGAVTAVGFGGASVGTYLQVAGIGGVPLSEVAQIL
jgi:flagellar basal-body rod modification protein FlgD